MATYRCTSNDFVHSPGIFNMAMHMGSNMPPGAQKEANGLFILASGWPSIPAGVLLDIVQGILEYIIDDDVVVIEVPDE